MTTRRLVLVRHAQADSGGPDLQRPLSERGRLDAAAVGRWLAANVEPDEVVVSPARRAVQTWEIAAAQLGAQPTTTTDRRIYDNSIDDLVDVARECTQSVGVLVMVGHNPSLQRLADADFPTASVAVLEFDGDWADFEPGAVTVTEVVSCRG